MKALNNLPLRLFVLFIVPSVAIAALTLHNASAQKQAPTPQEKERVAKEAFAILNQSCASCHTGEKPMGNLRLSNRADVVKGGASGSALSLQKPEESLLIKAVRGQGRQMPPAGKLNFEQVATLLKWVKLGAPQPKGETPPAHVGPPPVNTETMKFWSFQKVASPKLPQPKAKAWVKNPIDAFILSRIEKAGLAPNLPASKTALLRRASYDLIGLPPTPEEVRAFLADRSPNAYEKVIDRLLAMPQYGEKWGRHWLDLVRYAETNSYERDGIKPNVWKYRDYVVEAFNADMPYSQFVLEQLAGDELPNRTPANLIATGYYRLGLWDDEPADREQALYDDMDDIVSTTAQVFMGLSLNCARCHDHKLDPLPQKDYYRMLAFFAGVNRYGGHIQRPIVDEALVIKFKAEIKEFERNERENYQRIERIERKVHSDLSPVEKEEFNDDFKRPDIVKKRIGKKITQEEFDQYVASRNKRPEIEKTRPAALESAMAVTEDPQPRTTKILLRGNPHVPGDVVEPGFPAVLNPPTPILAKNPNGDSSGRRTALAKWLIQPENPLTARVIVNRVWQYHFGRGIVRTPSNFGFQGSKPTHPELLDWLANSFVKGGWRMKALHKQIMLSSTYQMSAQTNAKAVAKDPENDLFWRFDMRRLQAEEMRDSILAANGSLNKKRGGASIYVKIPDEVHAGQSVPGAGWGRSSEEEQCRRSLYIHVKRSLITPIIASFDGPETDFSCPVRFATTQPTQALGMLNSEFINKEANVFAKFLKANAGEVTEKQVRLALWRVLQRNPTEKEVQRGIVFIQRFETKHKRSKEDALKYFCIVALNLNEFTYLE